MDYGPILFRFDSAQRKKPVIIFDSLQFVGKSSEWFFVRKNLTTLNETYRCVQCRSFHVKMKKEGNIPLNQGARIIVRQNRFITNPDIPLGEHICNFEHNEFSNTFMVWSRRALLRANSELRLNPEKPKLKFCQLMEAIKNGKNEYGIFYIKNLRIDKNF